MLTLTQPRTSVMDLNIGVALWLGARGVGVLWEKGEEEGGRAGGEAVRSAARVVLMVGLGRKIQHRGAVRTQGSSASRRRGPVKNMQ